MPAGHKQIENLIERTNLSGTYGSHGLVQLVTKLKKDRTRSTRYVMIAQDKNDPGFVAEYSAIVSEITRFISTTVNPKVRTITQAVMNTTRRKTVGLMSGAINGYKEAHEFLQSNTVFTQLQKKQLAEMFTGAYFTGENDLHNWNWGKDNDGNIVKIDNDQAFFNFTAQYKRLEGAFNSNDFLQSWPNSIYDRKNAFDITSEDIKNLPFLINSHPSNWPTHNQGHPQALINLAKDLEFIKYKYLNLTKLLLIKHQQINHCVATHCSDQDLSNGLNNYLINRKNALADALLLDPGYKVFLAQLNRDHSLMDELQTELSNYNNQYSRGGRIKENYRDRIFDVKNAPLMTSNIADWMSSFTQAQIQQRSLLEAQKIKKTEIQALKFLLNRAEFKGQYNTYLKLVGELESNQALTVELLRSLKSKADPIILPLLERIVQRISDVNLRINGIQSTLTQTTVTGLATVTGPTTVTGPAIVAGPTTVTGPAIVAGPTTVTGPAIVAGPTTVTGPAIVAGPTTVTGPATIEELKQKINELDKRESVRAPSPSQNRPVTQGHARRLTRMIEGGKKTDRQKVKEAPEGSDKGRPKTR